MTSLLAQPTPYRDPVWYRRAGVPDDAVTWLHRGAAGAGVWLAREPEHHFHDLPALLGEFAAPGDPDLLALQAGPAPKVLLTAPPYGYRGGVGPATADEARALVADVVRRAHEVDADLVLSHYLYDEDDAAWRHACEQAGAETVVLGADAVLDVTWPDLEHYRRWLGPGRRSLRHGPASRPDWPAPSTVIEDRIDPALADRLVALLAAGRHDDPVAPPDSLLRAAVEGDIPRDLLVVPDPGGGVRAVAVLLHAGERDWIAKFFGSTAPRTDYFAVGYTHVVAHAVARGRGRVHYGGGAHRAKLLRGARLRPGFAALLPVTPAAEGVVRLARRVGRVRRAGFAALVARWQHPDHPEDPAFACADPDPEEDWQ